MKTAEEIKILRECGRILATILHELETLVVPGISTATLEAHATKRLEELGAAPAFIGYRGGGKIPFSTSLCTSINEEVVHAPALPGRVVRDGDILSLDFGARYPTEGKGFYTDMAVTMGVGAVSHNHKRLIEVTQKALFAGLSAVRPGAFVHDISHAIQKYIAPEGFGIVREFVGHGVGYSIHEEPQIFNFVETGQPRVLLKEGMCLAIEPMVTLGKPAIKVLSDGWTAVTKDKSIAAHFELTIVVTKNGYEVLTRT